MCPSFHRISPPHARVPPLVHRGAHWVRHGVPSDAKKRKRNQRTRSGHYRHHHLMRALGQTRARTRWRSSCRKRHSDARRSRCVDVPVPTAVRLHTLTHSSDLASQDAARPKTLQREEWMLVPPTSSDLLSSASLLPLVLHVLSIYLSSPCGSRIVLLYTELDPTKLSKPRQFSRSAAPARVVDNTLWTETPAERQQRLADEVMGKKRRAENADDVLDPLAEEDANKRRKRDAELQRQVEEYTVRLPSPPVPPDTKINYISTNF